MAGRQGGRQAGSYSWRGQLTTNYVSAEHGSSFSFPAKQEAGGASERAGILFLLRFSATASFPVLSPPSLSLVHVLTTKLDIESAAASSSSLLFCVSLVWTSRRSRRRRDGGGQQVGGRPQSDPTNSPDRRVRGETCCSSCCL